MTSHIGNSASKVNLDDLAAQIRRECDAAIEAGRVRIDHAIAAGKHALEAQERVGRGFRRWLQLHQLRKSTVYDYMLLARSEGSVRSSGHSSIAAALRMLRGKPKKAAEPKSKSPLSKAIWSAATIEERRRFLDSIGVNELCAAISPAFRTELRRRVGGQQAARTSALGGTLAAAFRQALSLQKSAAKDAPAMGVVSTLNAINNKLTAAGFDLNHITGVVLDATATDARKRAA